MGKSLSALAQGVQLIGIGKHGSKKLPEELIVEITNELIEGAEPPLLVGAFFGAVMMKDIEPEQLLLEDFCGKGSLSDPEILWEHLFVDTPNELKSSGIKLLSKEILSEQEAEQLGDFLMSKNEDAECFKGMVLSVLRIRYETMGEYQGLYNAIVKTARKITIALPKNPSIQLAEPFDGVNRSYIITPILANNLQELGYTTIVSCGKSSGPKNVLNTYGVYRELNADFLTKETTEINSNPIFGWALNQKEFFPALDPWVYRRRTLMKRPYLATLEKVLNPCKAETLITSVFHIPYLDKMIELGFMAGFKNVLVLKRGQEGSLAPSLSKATGLRCAVKKTNGSVLTKDFDCKEEMYQEYKLEEDNFVEDFKKEDNFKLITAHLESGTSNNDAFDKRIKFATLLYEEGLQWVYENNVE